MRSVGMTWALASSGLDDAGAAQGGLENGFLLQHHGLRGDQVPAVAGQLRPGAGDLHRRQRPHVHLLLVVVQQFLRIIDRLLRDLDVFDGAHQTPVQLRHVGHGVDDLLLEHQVVHLLVDLGDADGAVVHRE